MDGMPKCPKCDGTVFKATQVTVSAYSAPSVPYVAIFCGGCETVISIVPLTTYK